MVWLTDKGDKVVNREIDCIPQYCEPDCPHRKIGDAVEDERLDDHGEMAYEEEGIQR